MTIDIYAKSSNLLEALANTIYDRETPPVLPFTFTLKEVQCVEKWLKDLLSEIELTKREDDKNEVPTIVQTNTYWD